MNMRLRTSAALPVLGWALGIVAAGWLGAGQARAQEHSILISKTCAGPLAVGDNYDCTFTVSNSDGFPNDDIDILGISDTISTDPETVVTFGAALPAGVLSFEIVDAGGNTTCAVSGTLPCRICNTLTLGCPGAPDTTTDGFVQFRMIGPAAKATDGVPGALPNTRRVEDLVQVDNQDLCGVNNGFPETPGCPVREIDPQTSATIIEIEPPPRGELPNFKCYAAKFPPPFRSTRRPVTLLDQFGTTNATVLQPFEICNPVDKNGEGIDDPEAHLMCYKLRVTSRRVRHEVASYDQFGSEELRTGGSRVLCQPALKNNETCVPNPTGGPPRCELEPLQARLPHLNCYDARTEPETPPFESRQASLADQFESDPPAIATVVRTTQLCNPIQAKNDETLSVPTFSPEGYPFPVPPETPLELPIHYKCYSITEPAGFRGARVTVEDQFGTFNVRAGKATRLCEPAVKVRLD